MSKLLKLIDKVIDIILAGKKDQDSTRIWLSALSHSMNLLDRLYSLHDVVLRRIFKIVQLHRIGASMDLHDLSAKVWGLIEEVKVALRVYSRR